MFITSSAMNYRDLHVDTIVLLFAAQGSSAVRTASYSRWPGGQAGTCPIPGSHDHHWGYRLLARGGGGGGGGQVKSN